MKRVVTGAAADGRDGILAEGAIEPAAGRPGSSNQTRLHWAVPERPVLPHDGYDPLAAALTPMPAPGEGRFMTVTFAPGSGAPMHATPTVDFVAVMAGELWLVMPDGSESRLSAGDTVVQNGTLHAWENRSDAPCTIAATMIGAHRND